MPLRDYTGQFRSDLRRWGYGDRDRLPTRWLLLSLAYASVRWALIPDLDVNEDFNCGHCSKPVLRRWLYCSAACAYADGGYPHHP